MCLNLNFEIAKKNIGWKIHNVIVVQFVLYSKFTKIMKCNIKDLIFIF